ncbi:MAG: STAS domain-containing protein [bacterium]
MNSPEIKATDISALNKITIVKVRGYLDVITAEALESTLDTVKNSKCYKIILDLDEVEYIGSMAWSIFLNTIKELRDHNGDLKLAQMHPNVFEVYKLLEFFWFLKAYKTIEEAVSDFKLEVQPMP